MQQQHVTATEVEALSRIINGVSKGSRLTIAIDGDVERLFDGVMRYLTDAPDTSAHGSWNRNMWDQWVRVSGTFERWFSVREIVTRLATGMASIR